MKRFLTLALVGLLVSCAQRDDRRIADYTRAYLDGRISYRRYCELCQAVSAGRQRIYTPSETTSSDSSSSSTNDTTANDDKKKNEKCKDDKHPGQPCPHPPGRH